MSKREIVDKLATLGTEGKIPINIQPLIGELLKIVQDVDESILSGEFGIYLNGTSIDINKKRKIVNFMNSNSTPVKRSAVIVAIARVLEERIQKSDAAKKKWQSAGSKIITQMKVSDTLKSSGENRSKQLNEAILAVTNALVKN